MILLLVANSGDTSFIQKVTYSKLVGFVHSTFNRTVNIHCYDDGELYTIGCNQIDNAPNTLIIDLQNFEGMKVDVNDQVYSANNIITIDNKMSIKLDNAKCWEGRLPAYPANTDILKKNMNKMKQYIEAHGKRGGINSKLVDKNPFEHELSRMIHERTDLLLTALLNKHMKEAVQHAVSLLGLGPGLTPSGDDFLVGLFTVFHLEKSPYFSYKWFCREVEKVAKTATNDISYMALKKASIGKVRETIISLTDALLYGNEKELIFSLKQVLNIGSSSGTDIALGILFGLEVNINIGGTL